MKICCRKGHTKACYGAVGVLDEYVENRKLFDEVYKLLKPYHTVIDVTPPDNTGWEELNIGINTTNKHNPDLFFSLHFNSSSGDPRGTEVCVYNTSSTAASYGSKICKNMESLGFTNRGIKERKGLAETSGTVCPAMIIEVCFVQKSDAALYRKVGIKKVARAIANAIDNRISLDVETSTNTTIPTDGTSEKLERTYTEYGVATVLVDALNVRTEPNTQSEIVATYKRNEKINYDKVYITNKYVYISYVGASGSRRYVASRIVNGKRYLSCI